MTHTTISPDRPDPVHGTVEQWADYLTDQYVREAANLLRESGSTVAAAGLENLLDCHRHLSVPEQCAPWPDIATVVDWLNDTNGVSEQETALRLLKVTEEAGEAAAAYIGATGQNPRKGTTHTADDVADELCDVIVSAMVALHSFTDQPARHLAAKVDLVTARIEQAKRIVFEPRPEDVDHYGTHYGVTLCGYGEDGDLLALGHVPARRALAAAARARRTIEGIRIRPSPGDDLPHLRHTWGSFTYLPEGELLDWECIEHPDQVDGAVPITVLDGEMGTPEFLGNPVRCPACGRMSTSSTPTGIDHRRCASCHHRWTTPGTYRPAGTGGER
ncbi:MazG-like family protein [Streptacidiphilus carbonis]|uniref:MazG-like family protein n=1 Tax=Streptacidiphilus carbonis TaxID=105422 RepID=UPI0007C6781B